MGSVCSRRAPPPSENQPLRPGQRLTALELARAVQLVKILTHWFNFTRGLFRIRRLQRYYGHIGQFLQTFSPELREALKREIKKVF